MPDTPKRIAVVAYGEDISNRHVSQYDHVVAVNRASGTVFAEYTVCADYQAVQTFVTLNPQTIYVADRHNATRIRQDLHLPNWRVVALEPPGEYTASIFLAIWFAANHLAANEIDVYGARWSGHEDADGYSDETQRRTPERWIRERRQFNEMQNNLQVRGIVLRRLLLEDVKPE